MGDADDDAADSVDAPEDAPREDQDLVQSPRLTFPANFCCNCGDTDCTPEAQDTRVSRFFAIRAGESTFRLPVPVCGICRRTTRRRPPGFFVRMLVLGIFVGSGILALWVLGLFTELPLSVADYWIRIGAAAGVLGTLIFYRLRRPRSPRTSFYQPVRIKEARVQFAGVMGGPGSVEYLKVAFTNPEYLHLFANANREAIESGHLEVVAA